MHPMEYMMQYMMLAYHMHMHSYMHYLCIIHRDVYHNVHDAIQDAATCHHGEVLLIGAQKGPNGGLSGRRRPKETHFGDP